MLALDIGTGSAHVRAYDLEGTSLAHAEAGYPVYYDHPAWAEQEPEAWWQSAVSALRQCVDQLAGQERPYIIRGIGLTGQSPTIAPFDGNGRPLRRGILYQDNRAVSEAEEWVERLGGRASIHARTGHDPAAFYIGPKLLWIRRHEPEVFARAARWLQPRDFIALRLTGHWATDWSHAGSTLLFDIHTRTWAMDFLATLDLSPEMVPPAMPPWTVLGEIRTEVADSVGLPGHTPVVLGGADSQCCALGAGVLRVGELSDMAGTSTCLNSPVTEPLADLRIANYCHVVPEQWCTELGLNASGAALEWLASLLAPPGQSLVFAEIERAASESAAGANGLLFLPYIADGERFNPSLRGGFYGLSLRHSRGDLARSVLEGVAFAIREHLETMSEAGAPVRQIHVSGGGAHSPLWNQIKADVTGIPVATVASDATALGVAVVAGTAIGLYPSLEYAVRECSHLNARYEPEAAFITLYTERYQRFRALALATAEERSE
jgi:xylulokinase